MNPGTICWSALAIPGNLDSGPAPTGDNLELIRTTMLERTAPYLSYHVQKAKAQAQAETRTPRLST